MKEALVMFAKAPLAGQVKTRLIGRLTAEQAAEMYVCFLRDTFALMEAVQEMRETLSLVLCYTPADEVEAFEAADLDGCLLLAQREGNLGERLQHGIADLFESGFQSVVIIGADSPTLPAEIIEEALTRLETPGQLVIGPAADGGCYLLGLNHTQETLFELIDWTQGKAFSQLQSRASEMGSEFLVLPQWYDVDTADDLARLQEEMATAPTPLQHTSRFFRKLSRSR